MNSESKPNIWHLLPVKANEYHIKRGLKKVPDTRFGLNEMDKVRANLEKTCRHYGITTTEVVKSNRKGELVYIRQAFVYWCSQVYDLETSSGSSKFIKPVTLSSIGILLGGKDHTSMIHSIKTFRDRIETDAPVPVRLISPYRTTKQDYINLLKALE